MKIRIYAQDAEPFSAGGGSPLTPTRCEITANLNSDWTLTLEHPLDADGMYKQIQSGAVLRMPAFNGSQLYRIITADRTDSGITATAEPIFMDALHDVFLLDSRPTNLSGQDALDHLMSGTKFSGQSDILNLNTAYYVRKNLIEALNGEDENAFTSRWGGEILFDNYKVIINQSAGRDKGVVVKYGRNLTGITETVDRSSLITRIIPVGYDGIMLSGSAPWVDSPLINSYPIIYNSVIEYSDVKVKEDPDDPDEDGFATLAEAQAELTRLANLEYSQNNVDKELVSMDVDLILLQNTVEYAEFKNLEDVSLGDTVTCRHAKLGIDVSAKVVSLTWDCITGRVTAVTLGNFKQNYFSSNTNRVDQALGNASSAQNAAQNAQNVASGAQSAANQAQQAAGDAQTAAGNAQTAAGTAQSAADQAQQAAGNAQSAAQGAQNTADSALNAAQGAQNTANQANQNAQNAQTAAGNAQSAAQGAQNTADSALNAAQGAQSTANQANKNAQDAQQTANDVSDLVNKVVRPNGTVIADRVQGIIDATITQLHLQNTAAQKQNVRAILFEDLDPNSDLYGAISIGTQGWQIAKERTSDGLDWNWKTAATANGIVANVISAGTLQGVEILADKGTIGGWTINQDSISKTVEFEDGTSYNVTLYGNAKEKVLEIGMANQDPQYVLYSNGRSESMTQLVSKELVCSPLQEDWENSSPSAPFFIRCQYMGSYSVNSMALRFTSLDYSQYNCFAALSPYMDSAANINLGAVSLPFYRIYGCDLYLGKRYLDGLDWKAINKFEISDTGIFLRDSSIDNSENPIVFSLIRNSSGYSPGLLSLFDTGDGTDQILSFRVDPMANTLSMYNTTAKSRYIYLNAVTGAGTFHGILTCSLLTQTSDERLKKNIATLGTQESINFIMGLRPTRFEFKSENDDEVHAGFIAQEVSKLQSDLGVVIAEETELPPPEPDLQPENTISEEPQTEWTINYSAIIAPLVSVVQSQQTEIEQLKQKLSELEAKIN